MGTKKWLALLVDIVLMMATMAATGTAETTGILSELGGTYTELFPVICAPEYDGIWLEMCTEVVGAEQADATAKMLKNVCQGELYGEDAIAAFGANPEAMQFNCSFINGVAQFTIDGNIISGTDENGATVFSHIYTYVYLNLWSLTDPTDAAKAVRRAMRAAGFAMMEESDKGYNHPAYNVDANLFTVGWTWVYREAIDDGV